MFTYTHSTITFKYILISVNSFTGRQLCSSKTLVFYQTTSYHIRQHSTLHGLNVGESQNTVFYLLLVSFLLAYDKYLIYVFLTSEEVHSAHGKEFT
jgi:hypothetical protein